MTREFRPGVAAWITLLAIVVLMAGIAPLAPAHAQTPRQSSMTKKLVGVVFDDSGSMQGRDNLPVFGIQVLATSLSGEDRLYGVTLRQFLARQPPTEFSIRTSANRRTSIASIGRWGADPQTGTPYGAVEYMLRHLVQVAAANEDVHLFIFTDGEFNASPDWQDNAAMRRRLEDFRGQLQGKPVKNFTLHFIAFNPVPAAIQQIKSQGVSATLAEVFNGNPDANVYFPQGFEELRVKLVDTIARIAETDVEPSTHVAGAGGKPLVNRQGATVEVTPPFTIAKVIVISTAPRQGDLPRLVNWPKAQVPAIESYPVAMKRADTVQKAGPGAGTVWYAAVDHLDPQPVLAANRTFTLEFDRPITQQTSILYRTDIAVEWAIYDPTKDIEIRPDANNTVTLAADQQYEVRARILDRRADAGKEEVPLSSLPPNTRFEFIQKDAQGRQDRRPLIVDPKLNRAVLKPLEYRQKGTADATVSIQLPGFVTYQDRGIKINVVDPDLHVLMEAIPQVLCPACSATRAEPIVLDRQPFKPAMLVTATIKPKERERGKVVAALAAPLPPGVRVAITSPRASGPIILEGANISRELDFVRDDKIELMFEVDGNFLKTLPRGLRASLSVNGVQPLIGGSIKSFDIVPRLEQAEIVFAGTTDGQPGDSPLRVKPDQLRGNAGFFIRVLKAHGEPQLSDFQVSIGGMSWVLEQQPNKDIVLVRPRPATWCDCFIETGSKSIEIGFRNALGQEAPLRKGAMMVEPVTWLERLMICLLLIIATLTMLWLLWGLWRMATSFRFPSSSRVLVYQAGRRRDFEPRPLAQRPWPWLKPFIPFMNPNEKRDLFGLRLEAGPEGIRILHRPGGYTAIKKSNEVKPLSQHFVEAREPVPLFWGEKLEEMSRERMTYEFVEQMGDG